jgi:protein gp37
MSATRIEWADCVWNPITGCAPVSEGCDNCYARQFAMRLRGRFGYHERAPFSVTIHENRMMEPAFWRKPRRVFLGSMTDMYGEWFDCCGTRGDLLRRARSVVHATVRAHPKHTFMELTKRADRMWQYWSGLRVPENLWVGVSAETQERAAERFLHLSGVNAAVRFLSVEPMLGLVRLAPLGPPFPGWVICGGETGPRARPCWPDWVLALRDECGALGIPFFFKHPGTAWTAYSEWEADDVRLLEATRELPESRRRAVGGS